MCIFRDINLDQIDFECQKRKQKIYGYHVTSFTVQ